MPDAALCPGGQDLQRFLLGQMSPRETEIVAEHVLGCERCTCRLDQVKAEDGLVAALRAPGMDQPEPVDETAEHLIERVVHLLPTACALETPVNGSLQATGDNDATLADYDFLAPPEQPGELGRLGPYRVLRVLGVGGMGVVFQAEDPLLQRTVALKTLKPALAASSSFQQRFLSEGRTAARIEDDHIVSILHVSEDRGVPFLVMPLLRGETLEACLKRKGRLPVEEVLPIGQEIAAGLAAAHARGVIHCDIKPSNIWLEDHGHQRLAGRLTSEPLVATIRVKILDFGVAQPLGTEVPATPSEVIVGTPAYMAPEQARGEPLDARCDLFSLGCVLYRLCTGQPPFPGTSTLARLRSLELHQPRPPHLLNPQVPPALSELILKLLARDPSERLASAEAVAAALADIQASHPKVEPPCRRRYIGDDPDGHSPWSPGLPESL